MLSFGPKPIPSNPIVTYKRTDISDSGAHVLAARQKIIGWPLGPDLSSEFPGIAFGGCGAPFITSHDMYVGTSYAGVLPTSI